MPMPAPAPGRAGGTGPRGPREDAQREGVAASGMPWSDLRRVAVVTTSSTWKKRAPTRPPSALSNRSAKRERSWISLTCRAATARTRAMAWGSLRPAWAAA
jgi:hypothetical protein